MGHDSERAAKIYLHGSDARQHEIADTLSKLTLAELKGARAARAGSHPARNGYAAGRTLPEDQLPGS